MVEINPVIFTTQIISFFIAMPLIWIFFLKPLIKNIQNRDKFIRDSIEKIENEKKEIEQMKNEYEKKLNEIEENAKITLNKTLAEGEKIKQKMIEEAKNEGNKMVEEAKKEIKEEKKKAIESIKNIIVDISILAAEKTISKKLSKREQLSIINRYIKDIEKRVN